MCLGLLVVPAIGHAASAGLAWAPLVAGAAGYLAVALYGYRAIHRWMAYGGVAAGAWAAAAWWVGLTDPIVVGTYFAGLLAAVFVWSRYVRPRARVRVEGGSVWPWHWERFRFRLDAIRDCRRAMESWRVASYWGRVPRSEIRAAVADIGSDHYLLVVELVPGHLFNDLAASRAASAIGAPESRVVIVENSRDPDRPANVLQVQWFHAALELAVSAEREEPAEEKAEPGRRPEPVDLEAVRLERLRAALDRIGPQTVSARGLAKAAELPHDWVTNHITQLAPRLGLRRVKGGWQRLAMAAGGDS